MGGSKCQFSVKFLAICQLSVFFSAICQLSEKFSVVSKIAICNDSRVKDSQFHVLIQDSNDSQLVLTSRFQ